MLKFSSIVLPAIGSTISTLPPGARTSAELLAEISEGRKGRAKVAYNFAEKLIHSVFVDIFVWVGVDIELLRSD